MKPKKMPNPITILSKKVKKNASTAKLIPFSWNKNNKKLKLKKTQIKKDNIGIKVKEVKKILKIKKITIIKDSNTLSICPIEAWANPVLFLPNCFQPLKHKKILAQSNGMRKSFLIRESKEYF